MSNRVINLLVPDYFNYSWVYLLGRLLCYSADMIRLQGYIALWNGIFGDAYAIGETIRQISPYILAGLAVAFAFRTGLFNIGVEGQLIVGWFAAAYVGMAFELPKIIHLPFALIAAAVAGALWGLVPGILKATFVFMKLSLQL